ncbi:hypothetical protein LY76DRAFT_525785, partial [Colletotrichum caudatum]
ELDLRTTALYTGSLMSSAFSGLIAAGINDNMDGARGLNAWQWPFLIDYSTDTYIYGLEQAFSHMDIQAMCPVTERKQLVHQADQAIGSVTERQPPAKRAFRADRLEVDAQVETLRWASGCRESASENRRCHSPEGNWVLETRALGLILGSCWTRRHRG